MPLHVNLYHEIQRQDLARRRDPLRLGMMGMAVIASGFVLYYLVALGQAHEVTSHYNEVQSEFAGLDPKAKAAKTREDELNQQISASTDMQQAVDSRFYWAPVMGQILSTVPRTVQLTRLSAAGIGDGHALANTVTIVGVVSGDQPRKGADALRTALATRLGAQYTGVSAVFKSLEDSEEVVMLDGRRLPTALFTIEIQMQGRAVAAAAPAPARKTSLIASK